MNIATVKTSSDKQIYSKRQDPGHPARYVYIGIWEHKRVTTNFGQVNSTDRSQGVASIDSIKEFLYREADLLDQRLFREWLDLLTDDLVYSVPLRRNVESGEQLRPETSLAGRDVCWFDEGKETLSQRVDQISTGVHWAEQPPSRVSHLVTNIRILEYSLPEVSTSCRLLYYRNRVSDETDILVGRRNDRLRLVGGEWKLCRREVLLDQNVLMAKNMTGFF